MKIQTKRNLLRAATAAAVMCAAAVVFLPTMASAAPATATASVNVRGGPSTSYPIVDTLRTGQSVDVGGCRSGWCYVEYTGNHGFVSASYLRRGSAMIEPNFNLSFNFPQGSFSIGTGGVSIGLGSPPVRPSRPPAGSMPGDVCFYSSTGYTGSRFCMDRGDMTPYVGPEWNNRISSIRNPDGLRVTVCDDAGYDDCRIYTTNATSLGSFNNQISSISVR